MDAMNTYDLDIALPLTPDGKYLARCEAFFQHGLYDVPEGARVRLTVLLGPSGFLPFGATDVMSARGIHLRVLRFGREDPAAKLYGYYLSLGLEELGLADWWLRVDDDSFTHVRGVLDGLDFLSHREAVHLHAFPVQPWPHAKGVHDLLREADRPDLCTRTVVHDWEVGLSSRAAMMRALSNPGARHLLAGLNTPDQFGDIGLSLAMQVAGIFPAAAPFLDCGPSIDECSAWSNGGIAHIHNVAPDLPGWEKFTARADALPLLAL